MDMDLNISPNLQLQVRLTVLHKVIHELTEGFGVTDQRAFEIIEKGILKKQLIETLWIYYLNKAEEAVGMVSMTINWRTHHVLARSSKGKEFRLDPQQSISKQISELYPILVSHTKELRRAYHVQTIQFTYTFTQEVYNDSQKYRQAMQFLGATGVAKIPPWAQNLPDVELTVVPEKLRELQIKIEHNKPKRM
jgi:hypothetical protein